MDFANKAASIFLFCCFLILMFGLLIGLPYNSIFNRVAVDYSNGPIAVETNQIGCTKYRYYSDTFWKCPSVLDINSIEERKGKQTITVPVVP